MEDPIAILATEPKESAIRAASFSPDGRFLVWASGTKDGAPRRIHLQDLSSGKTVSVETDHPDTIKETAFSPDGRMLAALDFRGNLFLWETEQLQRGGRQDPFDKKVIREPLEPAEYFQEFAFSPDGATLAAGSAYGRVFLFDLNEGMKETGRFHSPDKSGLAFLKRLIFQPDGKGLLLVFWDGSVQAWDLKASVETWIPSVRSGFDATAMSPDGKTLALATHDFGIQLWDLESKKLRQTLDGHWDNVYVLVFSPDGRLLASGGKDGALRVTDWATRNVVEVLNTHTVPLLRGGGFMSGAAFSPDGKVLAVASGHVTSKWILWTWKVGAKVKRGPETWRESVLWYRDRWYRDEEEKRYWSKENWIEQVAYLWREILETSEPQELAANQGAFFGELIRSPEDRDILAGLVDWLRLDETMKRFAPGFLAGFLHSEVAGRFQEELSPLLTQLQQDASSAAGAEETESKDRAAWAELEGILRDPGAPRRVPVEIEKVSFGGARVLYRGAAGGIVEGFLPMGQIFSDPNRVMRMRAKVAWLAGRVRRGKVEVFPRKMEIARSNSRPIVIFRLGREVRADLFEEERVFQEQLFASDEPGGIRRFLSWSLEGGADPRERLIQMYHLGAWEQLKFGQSRESIAWLADHVEGGYGRALLLLFRDLLETSLRWGRRREWPETQEAALRGIARLARVWPDKEEMLEVIQALAGLPLSPEQVGYLREAAEAVGTGEAHAWLDQVTAAGAEETREFDSVEQFMGRYAEALAKQKLTGWVDAHRERGLPTRVWVVPAVPASPAVVPDRVGVYVTSWNLQEQEDWEIEVQKRLNREQDRLKDAFFEVKALESDSKFERTAVIIRQSGGIKPAGDHPVIIKLSFRDDIEQLRPAWVYAVAVNESLWGKEIGPVLGVLTFQDAAGRWVHAIFA